MGAPDLKPGLLAVGDFRRTWPQLFLLSLVSRIGVALVLLPALGLVLRLVLGGQGRAALSDEEIVFFFFSPAGIATLVVLGGAFVGVALLEVAGLMVIGCGATESRRVAWYAALRFVLHRLAAIFRLGARLVVSVLLPSAPILALVGGVFWLFLRDYDINYYLTNRPPEFLWAGGICGVLVAALGILLLVRVLGWAYALPSLLFEGQSPRAALRESTANARGRRRVLFGWLVGWLSAGWLAAVAGTWTLGLIGRLVVPQGSESVSLVAFTIGAVGVLSIAINVLLSFVSASFFALIIVRLYRRDSSLGPLDGWMAEAGTLGEGVEIRSRGRRVLWGGVAALAAAAVAAVILVSSLRLEDHAVVIAHRGAAAHAPENTMASVRMATEDGADFIEIDVQETADGDVVVFHDSDFMKTAGNPLKIWEARRSDLAAIDIGSWFNPTFADERVPTLEEVLLAVRGSAKVNIELKYYGHDDDLERKVIDIVERTSMTPHVVLMSLKYDKVRKIRSLRPDWTYGLLTTVNLGDATRFDVDFLAVNVSAASRGFVRRAHSAGREVYVWTVNDPFAMSAMMSRGVDGVITDDPGLARRVLEIRSELSPVERLLVGIGTEVGVFSMPTPQAAEDDA